MQAEPTELGTPGRVLNKDFGRGWMSRNARDLFRIAVFAGFSPTQLLRLIELSESRRGSQRKSRTVTEPTVQGALDHLTFLDLDKEGR